VERLLGALPGWFGIESSNASYVEAARTLTTYLAWPGDGKAARSDGGAQAASSLAEGSQPAGVLLARRHFPGASEIHLMAVEPSWHGLGAGRALVEALERDLVADGVRLLQVKTLGPTHPDLGYRRTRLFYQGLGFAPLEEIIDLWPGNPCLIMVKVLA
jgi:GNAT superfamily N-acetyltransferase